jgi:hypothetical protein
VGVVVADKRRDAKTVADEYIARMRQQLEAGPSARRLAAGTPENNYETTLTKGAEEAYRKKFGAPEGGDYDLRGAFAEGLTDGKKAVVTGQGVYFPGHLPDTYKKPDHETFSNESAYSQYEPNLAGSWDGDRYTPNKDAPPEWLREFMNHGAPEADPEPLGLPDYGPDPNYVPGQTGDENWGPGDDDAALASASRGKGLRYG